MNTHIVVVNWNNAPQTLRCLRSLEDLAQLPCKVWVVDNGSEDGSADRLAEFIDTTPLPAQLIRSAKNLGFGGGCNLAITQAFAEGADSVWLLNNDAVADRDALQALQHKLASDDRIGAVGSVIYDLRYPKRVQVWGGGRILTWAGMSTHFRRSVADSKIDYLTGASLLLRREALLATGLFDGHEFFMYWEDADLCQRLRREGWRLAVASDSRVWHEHSSSLGKTHALKDFYVTQSAGAFLRRYSTRPKSAWYIGTTLRLLRRMFSGQAANWRAIHAAWKGQPPPQGVRPTIFPSTKTCQTAGKPFRIAIEASTMEGRRAGIGHYTEQLSEALAGLPGVELRFFTSRSYYQKMPAGTGLRIPGPFWTRWKKRVPLGRELQLWLQGRQLAKLTRKWRPDIVFGPNYVLPRGSAPQVLVIHDLSHLRHPEFHPPGRVRFLKRHLGPAMAHAQAIITVSRFTKAEVLTYYPWVAGRVQVIYPGISERFRQLPTDEQQRALDVLLKGEQRPYLLFLSTLEPRKNIRRLLEAYRNLPAPIRQRYPLVMTGQMGWQESQFAPLLQDLIARGEVILTGYIRDELLPALYHRAQALLYPSLYEGFGLPPVEAMACGCPVLVSNVTSMPEVCKDYATYCDPYDVESIRQGILNTLLQRDGSRRSASDHSESFLWKKSALTFLRLFNMPINHPQQWVGRADGPCRH